MIGSGHAASRARRGARARVGAAVGRACAALLGQPVHSANFRISHGSGRGAEPAVACEPLEPRRLLADPVISEFMADNTTGLTDGNGKRGDWIEIHNPNAAPVDLAGWHLTDDPADRVKYTFPSFSIPGGGYKVVFATGETTPYVDAAGYPHTSFKLDIDGEFLALVKPDGTTRTSEFDPFPPQSSNISYGIGADSTAPVTPVAAGASARYLIPTSAPAFGSNWTSVSFTPTGWSTGNTGIGYENNPGDAINYTSLIQTAVGGQMYGSNRSVYMRLPFTVADPDAYSSLALKVKYDDGFVAYLNGRKVAERNAPASPAWNSLATATHADSQAVVYETIDLTPYLSSLATGTNVLAIQAFNTPNNSTDFVILPELSGTRAQAGAAQYYVTPTPATANVSGSVVINEIHYDPDEKTRFVEYVELYNPGTASLSVAGWTLAGGVDYTFPAGSSVPGGGYLLVAENPTHLSAKFGKTALGPWAGALSNDGESIRLLTPAGAEVDRVRYGAGFPWPTVGDPLTTVGTGPSIQLVNPAADNDLGGNWRSAAPTPGAANSGVFAVNPPPAIRQAEHAPTEPASGQPVTITAKVTDPDGVASVVAEYQVNAPGGYIPYRVVNASNVASANPAYETGWVSLTMYDDGTHGDAVAGDAVYSAQVPAGVNQNRTLVRYRVRATDALGATIRAPYADDPGKNFAYFVYNGVPGWSGAARPGVTGVQNFSADDMRRMPVYFLLASAQDVSNAQHVSTNGYTPQSPGYGGEDDPWAGTFVYDGQVYDNIRFRARGGVWRYSMGKNMWKFDFNRNHWFEPRDDYGRKYDVKWKKLNFSAIIQQGDYWHRGEQGLFESVGLKLFNLAGVAAPSTHYAQFRVVDGAAEAGASQYDGDLWGLYLALEQPDGNMLEAHGLPDGNFYKMEGGTGTSNNQGPTQPTNRSDLDQFLGTYTDATPDSDDWWRNNLDLSKYYSYQAVLQGIHHYDIAGGKNYFYYNNPETNHWEVHPWDLDLTWSDNMFNAGVTGGNEPFKSRVLATNRATFLREYANRIRELQDLLFNSEQVGYLIDQQVELVDPTGVANTPIEYDRAMWDYNPIMTSAYVNASKAGAGRFYAGNPGSGIYIPSPGGFRGMAQKMKDYVVYRNNTVLNPLAADSLVPNTPTVAYTGASGYAIDGLTFRASAFSSPGNNAGFAGMRWRIAEVYDPANPAYTPTMDRPYEITAAWESGTLGTWTPDVTIPAGRLQPGRTYRVRVQFVDANGRASHWSAPAQFVAGAAASSVVADLRVGEVMYHPADPPAGSPYLADDFEYVELINKGTSNLDLTGVKFTDGIDFAFPDNYVLAPGQRALVVKNLDAFRSRYGTGLDALIAGQIQTKSLSNSGDHLRLEGAVGQTVLDFSYGDAWYPHTDGEGFSLVAADVNAATTTWGRKEGWRASRNVNGDPGTDVANFEFNSVVVNEVMANPSGANRTWIEIRNTTAAPADVSSWYLSDDPDNLRKYEFGATVLAPAGQAGSILLLDEAASYGIGGSAFVPSRGGGTLYLTQADAAGNLLGYREVQAYGASDAGVTLGRYVKSTGKQDFVALKAATPGGANAAPVVGPVVISEVLYNPLGGYNEYVELRNVTGSAVDLSGWSLSGVTFTFPAGTVLPAHRYLVVAAVAPGQFSAPPGTLVLGPFAGVLDDAGEVVQLLRPGVPLDGVIPWIEVDRLSYASDPPWPTTPNGTGPSLRRIDATAYGNDVINWAASTATGGTPGRPNAPTVGSGAIDAAGAARAVTVRFSEDVSSTLAAGDLVLVNLDGGSVPASTFTWDFDSLTATWTFDTPLPDGNYRGTVASAGVADWTGAALDGDRNGTAGGDLAFDFFALAGDLNADRTVNSADLRLLYGNLGKTAALPSEGDLTRDGAVTFEDYQRMELLIGHALAAPAEPVEVPAPAPVPVTSMPVEPAPTAPQTTPSPMTPRPATPQKRVAARPVTPAKPLPVRPPPPKPAPARRAVLIPEPAPAPARKAPPARSAFSTARVR